MKQIPTEELINFIKNHMKIYDYIKRIYSIELVLKEESIRYMYLVSLISSDNIYNVETTQKALEEITFIKDNLNYMNLDEDIYKEVEKFIKKGLQIIKSDLKKYKELNL